MLHFSGRTGRYIEPAGGAATLNVLNLVHQRSAPRPARRPHKAETEENQTSQIDGLSMGANGHNVCWSTLRSSRSRTQPDQSPPGFVVVFQEGAAPAGGRCRQRAGSPLLRDEHVQRSGGRAARDPRAASGHHRGA